MHLRNELADAARTGPRAGYRNVQFHPTARVDPSAIIFSGAWIGPHVEIGPDCVIGPNAVIGAPGFGYDTLEDGSRQYRTHTAGVVIERDVHIHAGANISQGRHRPTVIREGARIDALVHVGHNAHVGRNALVVALSMLGGTSTVGEGGYVASGTVRDHVDIGAGSVVGLGAVVTKSVPDGETWAGVPARRFGHTPETVTASVPRSLRCDHGCSHDCSRDYLRGA